ncbi:Gfo/Idh/MocA family protein [Aeromicrobium sp. Leaf350]|uniref:Gfo/Idh/MocA family protein n=1 Tax=Aeromicrobium sp. Leaf350 TaxID=2876565 RepID=UPI001E634811|nr:Gfo/Idh/MocA family oxidoreductase [Aeromicrobium sp. Leaf350]
MADRLRWGILGLGGISRKFGADLRVAGLDLRAAGSRSQESADAFAAELEVPRAHASYAALVDDPEVDVVYVGTPHPFHAEHALLALRAGKHVLVEKPFTLNAAEARQVVAEAESRGLVVLEAMWTRFLPHMVRLREIVSSGAIGEVRALTADHSQRLPSDPEHRLQSPALGGGALLDLGIYPISLAHDVLGVPQAITARSTPTATGVDAQTTVVLTYDQGQQAVTHSALDVAGRNDAVVLGTEARVEIDPTWYRPTTMRVVAPDGRVVESFDGSVPGRGMQLQALELERLVREGRTDTDVLPPAESVAVMETLDEVRRQIGLVYPGE